MSKKEYQQPTMEVVQLQHRHHLLQASRLDTLSGKKGATPEDDTWYDLE